MVIWLNRRRRKKVIHTDCWVGRRKTTKTLMTSSFWLVLKWATKSEFVGPTRSLILPLPSPLVVLVNPHQGSLLIVSLRARWKVSLPSSVLKFHLWRWVPIVMSLARRLSSRVKVLFPIPQNMTLSYASNLPKSSTASCQLAFGSTQPSECLSSITKETTGSQLRLKASRRAKYFSFRKRGMCFSSSKDKKPNQTMMLLSSN